MTTTDRAGSYLDDLARMLADLDPAERDEVLAGVREHLDATVAEHPDDPAALDTALVRLGPPERIAAEARGSLTPVVAVPVPAPVPPPPAATSPGTARVAVSLVVGTTLLPVLLTLVSRSLDLVGDGSGMFGPDLPIVIGVVFGGLPWLVGVVCSLLAPGFSPATRAALVLAGPLTMVLVVATNLWRSPPLVSTLGCIVLLLVAAAALVRLGRRAWREGLAS